MLYREIIAVCSQIHTKYINTLCEQNVELLNVKLVIRIVTTELWSFESVTSVVSLAALSWTTNVHQWCWQSVPSRHAMSRYSSSHTTPAEQSEKYGHGKWKWSNRIWQGRQRPVTHNTRSLDKNRYSPCARMKAYRAAQIKIHSFLTSTTDVGKQSACPGHFTPNCIVGWVGHTTGLYVLE